MQDKSQKFQKKFQVAELLRSGRLCQKQKKNPSKKEGDITLVRFEFYNRQFNSSTDAVLEYLVL